LLLTALDQILSDPLSGFITLIVFSLSLIVAITVHEFSHALVAARLGDFTAKNLGRLTLNPKAHLDPLGTAMIFLVGFGWGKPTPVNPAYLRTGVRPGMAAVSLGGPISNVIVAGILAMPVRFGMVAFNDVSFSLFRGQSEDVLGYIVGSLIFWNLLLAAFNLIPIAPLDGFKVALGVLPREMSDSFARLERYGPVILLGLIFFPFIIPGAPSILFAIISPILNFLSFLVLGRQLL
jgi:Zn-dependent protease